MGSVATAGAVSIEFTASFSENVSMFAMAISTKRAFDLCASSVGLERGCGCRIDKITPEQSDSQFYAQINLFNRNDDVG